jgi:hypothetical protein
MISDPFCLVAPHEDTFDQRGVYKIGPMIEFIAALPRWDVLTHSGNIMKDEHLGERLCVSFSCLGWWVG